MATTTNYSWVTPDDTSLVKDGAAAIRSLGTSVDTTTKALNPSTTLGDIEYRSSTANTNTRLGIGTTGQVLAVSGGVPAWTTVSSAPTFNGARVTGASQLIAYNTKTAVAWNAEDFDTNTYHDNATNNSRLTVPSTGKYLVAANVIWDTNAGGLRRIGFMVNATTDYVINEFGPISSGQLVYVAATAILNLTAGDYVQCMVTQTTTAAGDIYMVGGTSKSSFQISYLGA